MDMQPAFSLQGKTALVTGAANRNGLCFGMARALHDAGAKVALLDVQPQVAALCESMGGAQEGYFAVQADLCERESMKRGFGQAAEKLGGRVDILLNGAGVQHREDALDFPEDAFRRIIDINLNAVFFLSQLAAQHMLQHGGGKIINIASMTSYFGSRRIPAYSASKGGVMQLTKALSNEWAEKGINVNAIAPGYMKTEITANLINTPQGKKQTERIPMGRWGTGEDLAGAVVFLAAAASDYISGIVLPVDGGYLGA